VIKAGKGGCYRNLGVCYYILNNYTQSCPYLEKSIVILEKIDYDLVQEEHKLGYYGLQVDVYTHHKLIHSLKK
jgi:hypothetical protein